VPLGSPRRLRRGVSRRPPKIEPGVHNLSSPQWPRSQPLWLEYQKDLGQRRAPQPNPAAASRNCSVAPTGDRSRMGHRHSPTQLGSDGELFRAGGGTASLDSRRDDCTDNDREEVKSIRTSAAGSILFTFLRTYQIFLSPFFGGACKYHPSCSRYAYEAIACHGARRGVLLALKRVVRCRPFTQGGYDPVPGLREEKPRMSGSPNAEPVR
jgi:putative membrane protein insertion efficiency factor